MSHNNHAISGTFVVAPSKPRAHMTATDHLPMVYRPGALDASKLPRRAGNTLTYRDGRKEQIK